MHLQEVLESLKVSLGTSDTKFSAALGNDKRISVAGAVKGSQSYLTRVGTFDVDLSLSGIILLVRVFLVNMERPACIYATWACPLQGSMLLFIKTLCACAWPIMRTPMHGVK